jgi:hypothetical protein
VFADHTISVETVVGLIPNWYNVPSVLICILATVKLFAAVYNTAK